MAETLLRVFVSHARVDSALADRLAADLKARGIDPWIDRSSIPGGTDWRNKIEEGIKSSQALVVMVTPAAMDSKWVLLEYRYALDEHKLVIPLYYEDCQTPIDLRPLQHIPFEPDYDEGFKQLLMALTPLMIDRSIVANLAKMTPSTVIDSAPPSTLTADPSLRETDQSQPDKAALASLSTPSIIRQASEVKIPTLRDLYIAASVAEDSNDLDRADVFYRQILDVDPNYEDGLVRQHYDSLLPRIHKVQLQRLREEALNSRRQGAWSQEIGALEALIALEPNDDEAVARIMAARQNLQWQETYESCEKLVHEGNLRQARSRLETLWREDPLYEDPAELAPMVGLHRRPSYEEVLAERRKIEAQARLNEIERQFEEAQKRLDESKQEVKNATDKLKSIQESDRKTTLTGYLRAFGVSSWVGPIGSLSGICIATAAVTRLPLVAAVILPVLATFAYFGGYRKLVSARSFSLLTVISMGVMLLEYLAASTFTDRSLAGFQPLFSHYFQFDVAPWWIFAAYAVLGMLALSSPFMVSATVIEMQDFTGSDREGIGCFSGVAAAVVGILIGMWIVNIENNVGWWVGGEVYGCAIGIAVGGASILIEFVDRSILWMLLVGVPVCIALQWLTMALFGLDSAMLLPWSIGLILGVTHGVGVAISIAVFTLAHKFRDASWDATRLLWLRVTSAVRMRVRKRTLGE